MTAPLIVYPARAGTGLRHVVLRDHLPRSFPAPASAPARAPTAAPALEGVRLYAALQRRQPIVFGSNARDLRFAWRPSTAGAAALRELEAGRALAARARDVIARNDDSSEIAEALAAYDAAVSAGGSTPTAGGDEGGG